MWVSKRPRVQASARVGVQAFTAVQALAGVPVAEPRAVPSRFVDMTCGCPSFLQAFEMLRSDAWVTSPSQDFRG